MSSLEPREPIRVLVVDDEPEARELFASRFGRRGFKVFTAPEGLTALHMLETQPVEVVVLDLVMPGMDGLAVLKEIKKRHPRVEVVLLTGHGSLDLGLEGMRLGAFDYELKPFRLDELSQKILAAHQRQLLAGGPAGGGHD